MRRTQGRRRAGERRQAAQGFSVDAVVAVRPGDNFGRACVRLTQRSLEIGLKAALEEAFERPSTDDPRFGGLVVRMLSEIATEETDL